MNEPRHIATISLEQAADAVELALLPIEDAWLELKDENRRLREALKQCLNVLEDEFNGCAPLEPETVAIEMARAALARTER